MWIALAAAAAHAGAIDLLVTDVSAVTLSWLPTGRPLLVTTPTVPYPPSALMDVVPQLAPDAAFEAAYRQWQQARLNQDAETLRQFYEPGLQRGSDSLRVASSRSARKL